MYRLILLLMVIIGCSGERSYNQDAGYISLAPNITESMYAIGAGDQLLAVSDFCNWPPDVKDKERIGGFLNPNLEKIIALKPDALLGLPSHQQLAAKLAAYGMDVVMIPNETIADVMNTIDTLGAITGKSGNAVRLINALQDSLSGYRIDADTKPDAMLVIGRDDGIPRNITVAGPGTFIHEIWQQTGGRNIFEDLENQYSMVNREAILIRDPDIVIEFRHMDADDRSAVEKIKNEWRNFNLLTAVQRKQIYVLSGDYCLIPGPRLYKLARDFSYIIKKNNKKNGNYNLLK